MLTPSFSDLGKEARDVLLKGYYLGLVKLGWKSKTLSEMYFNAGGTYDPETGKVFGSLESKYEMKDKGTLLLERWNTDNLLSSEVTLSETLLKHFTVGGEYSFSPKTGKQGVKVKCGYVTDFVNIQADVCESTAVQCSAVLKYNNFLGGYHCGYDSYKNVLLNNNFGIVYVGNNAIAHTAVNDGNEYTSTIFQRINHKLDTCIHLSWSKDSNNSKFGVGAKYVLDTDATLRFKVDNSCLLGLAYQQKIREGIKITLCALIDCKNFERGGHKIGMALEFEAL